MWKRVALVGAVALLVGGGAQGARSTAPANTAPPTISGTARQGETLIASSGSWSGSTPITFSYRWQRCNSSGGNCSNISGANSQTRALSGKDVGHRLRISVTASNDDGSANAVSGATDVIANGDPKSTSPPTISGTAMDGQTLTAGTGSWTNNPKSFSYQWRRCSSSGGDCKDVGKDKQAYTLVQADVGHTIRVRVQAKNAFGSATRDVCRDRRGRPQGAGAGRTRRPRRSRARPGWGRC